MNDYMINDFTGSQVVSKAFEILSNISLKSDYNITDSFAKAIIENFCEFQEVMEILRFGGYL